MSSAFHKSLNNLLIHFPDPFETPYIKNKPDSKHLFVIEQNRVRTKMNTVLKHLRKLLNRSMTTAQLNEIKQKWRELRILKTYYIQRFDLSNHQTILSTENDMNAYFLLNQLITEYDFILKTINKKLKENNK